MKDVLIIGSGGREHALAWSLAQSAAVRQIYVAPGNGGTNWAARDGFAPCETVDFPADDIDSALVFARERAIDLTVVGPEVPLALGIVDAFQDAGLPIFGPSAFAAQIEASKAFAKDFMHEQGIPTGEFYTADDLYMARRFLHQYHKPVVVKASGLAAGKGVIVTNTAEEAGEALHHIMVERAFGEAGEIVVIEERLQGREVSVLAFCDGMTCKPMLLARDYKRALDGNQGLNTGGMGAVAPVSDLSPALLAEIMETVFEPVLQGMRNLDAPYVGVLYAGLMLTDDGPRVLEYNCRFGDPETQVILPLLKTDLYEVLTACIEGRLDEIDLEWHDGACATVVAASAGYPQSYRKGFPITGLDAVQDSIVFHAGTRAENAQIVTSGGRVLAVSARAGDLNAALQTAYDDLRRLHFNGMQFRTDIGAIYE